MCRKIINPPKNPFQQISDQYTVKVVKEQEDIKELLEVGFEYLYESGVGVSEET